MAALPPLGPPLPQHGLGQPRGRGRGGEGQGPKGAAGVTSGDPQIAAAEAQRDANRQIEAANRSVEDARREADVRIDQIHDYYDNKSEEEYAKQEAIFENQKLKGYERLRDLKREQEKELSTTRRDGERAIDRLNRYYGDTTYATQREGDQKLEEIRRQQGHALDHAAKTRTDDLETANEQYMRQVAEVREGHDKSVTDLKEATSREYERMRGNAQLSTEQARADFERKFAERTAATEETLKELNDRASDGIRQVRRDYTSKLSAYSDRQHDPFYRLMDLDVSVRDAGDSFVLQATIPEHEQGHVNVAVKGDQLVLTGYRRNEEKLDLEPGRSQGTNTFQSFVETFPIDWPVDSHAMSRRFEGDQLIVTVPKRVNPGYASTAQSKADSLLPRARVERPKFPRNLPHVSEDPYQDAEARKLAQDRADGIQPQNARKRKGSAPLA